MNSGWASSELNSQSDDFNSLHSGLTVRFIATGRADFRICGPEELVRDVIDRNKEGFDFLPVVDEGQLVGLLSTKTASKEAGRRYLR